MSRFVEISNNIFAKAGITPKQARLLEVLFISPAAPTYADLAMEMGTSMQNVGRLVSTLRKKGYVTRYIGPGNSEDPVPCSEWEIDATDKAVELRASFPAWSDWIVGEQAKLYPPKKVPANKCSIPN